MKPTIERPAPAPDPEEREGDREDAKEGSGPSHLAAISEEQDGDGGTRDLGLLRPRGDLRAPLGEPVRAVSDMRVGTDPVTTFLAVPAGDGRPRPLRPRAHDLGVEDLD